VSFICFNSGKCISTDMLAVNMDTVSNSIPASISITIPYVWAVELRSELLKKSSSPDCPPCLSNLLGLIFDSPLPPTLTPEPGIRNLGKQKQGESGAYNSG
jgi:hypothetical protein